MLKNLRTTLKGIPGVSFMTVFLVVTTVFFIAGDADGGVIIAWIIFVTCGLILYSYAFVSILPKAFMSPRPFLNYAGGFVLAILYAEIPVLFPAFAMTGDTHSMFALGVANGFAQLFITGPVAWFVYKKYRVGKEELTSLRKELGQSSANIDLIRSQINPHFLFNALNTLYGTALQEKADRTGEGIQRLGDMMRFMLQENVLDSIPLTSEINYLTNYITLQRLRTDTSSTIQIDVDIQHEIPNAFIPPMLLIPFVENAFKHGISFLTPSYIKIVVGIKNDILYFDVTNSIHEKSESDPEKYSGGIGLESVKQRLQLFYPGEHELIVKESSKDYFVHLTLQLKKK